MNTRGNGKGLDLNREFDADGGPPEVNAFYKSLQHWSDKIELILNLHEDNPAVLTDFGPQESPDGIYLYDHRGTCGASTFARDLMLPLAKKFEVCSLSSLYGDSVQAGVISYGAGLPNKSLNDLDLLDNFLLKNGLTTHCITFETPTTWPLKKRESAQLDLIRSASSKLISRRNN